MPITFAVHERTALSTSTSANTLPMAWTPVKNGGYGAGSLVRAARTPIGSVCVTLKKYVVSALITRPTLNSTQCSIKPKPVFFTSTGVPPLALSKTSTLPSPPKSAIQQISIVWFGLTRTEGPLVNGMLHLLRSRAGNHRIVDDDSP